MAATGGGEKVGGIRQVSLTAAGSFSRLAAQMGTVSDCDTALTRWVIDDLVEGYVSWREECQAVRVAYHAWSGPHPGEREVAYARYVAALDREELAAQVYAHHLEHVMRIAGAPADPS
ncbi:MAG TPA: hypothetical protein VG275_13140 [Solirubrobacteraceae bacterium]|nr:hypothetical protein [Solirubrobacteraceae bacterium]